MTFSGSSGFDLPGIGAEPRRAMNVSEGTPILSVSNFTTSFMHDRQWIPVVRDVSFDLAAKETVAIVGESGSGKSITALSIMRLIPQASGRIQGSIKLAGRDLLTLPEQEMRDVRGNEVAMIRMGGSREDPLVSTGLRLVIGLHLPRHRGRRANESPCGRHVSRRDRRDRPPRGGVRQSAAPLHEEADGGGADR